MGVEQTRVENMASYAREFISKARTEGKVTVVADQQGWFQAAVDPNSELAQLAATLCIFGKEIEVKTQLSVENAEEESSPLALSEEEYAKWLSLKDKTLVLVKWSQMFENGK